MGSFTRGRCAVGARIRAALQRRWVRYLLRVAFTTSVLALLLTRIDLGSVRAALQLADIRLLSLGLGLSLGLHYVWATQRSLGLGAVRADFSVAQLLKVILIAVFYSLVLPGSVLAGGVASWNKLRRGTPRSLDALALLIYFRLVNTVTLLGIGLVGMWFDGRLSSAWVRAGIATAFSALVFASLPLISPRAAGSLSRMAEPILRRLWLPRPIRTKIARGWQAMTAFNMMETRVIVLVFGLSLLGHGVGVLLYHVLAMAVGIDLPVHVIGWVRSLSSLVQMMPVSVAGLGVREASLVLLLRSYDVPEAKALSLSLAVLAVNVVWGIVGGSLEAWDALAGLASRRQLDARLPRDDSAIP